MRSTCIQKISTNFNPIKLNVFNHPNLKERSKIPTPGYVHPAANERMRQTEQKQKNKHNQQTSMLKKTR